MRTARSTGKAQPKRSEIAEWNENFDIASLEHLRSGDATLGALIDRVGPYRIQFREPTFWSLARSIVFQQLNGRAASTIFERLERVCGEKGVTPESILRLRPVRMRGAGISPQKTLYLKDLARRTISGEIRFEQMRQLADEEIIERLTQVKGVGVWTVHMFLIFALRRPDVLPVGDYGIRTAVQKLYRLEELPKPEGMERIAQPWRPWASVACWYLWRSLDGDAEL